MENVIDIVNAELKSLSEISKAMKNLLVNEIMKLRQDNAELEQQITELQKEKNRLAFALTGIGIIGEPHHNSGAWTFANWREEYREEINEAQSIVDTK